MARPDLEACQDAQTVSRKQTVRAMGEAGMPIEHLRMPLRKFRKAAERMKSGKEAGLKKIRESAAADLRIPFISRVRRL